MKKLLMITLVASALMAASNARADLWGVQVECWGNCRNVTLTQVCGTGLRSYPVGVSCDDTATPTSGRHTQNCGGSTCGAVPIYSSDTLGQWCDDGPGYDAIVWCQSY